MSQAFKLTVGEDLVARLVFDLPNEKANKLSIEALRELEQITEDLSHRPDIKLLLFTSAKEGIFIAGADLNEFVEASDDIPRFIKYFEMGHVIFDKWADLPFPTVAVIDGACMGGGTEFALACTYRIATDSPKTKIALPETSLGIVPGWGGMQRLPRLTGLTNALQLILSGKGLNGKKAYKMKVVDAVIPAEFLEINLADFTQQFLKGNAKREIFNHRNESSVKDWIMEKNPLGRMVIFNQSRKEVLKKTKGHYPAPMIALDVMEKTCALPLREALAKEVPLIREAFPQLVPNAKQLVSLFFMQQELKKVGDRFATDKALPVRTLGVIGAGTMGAGIAYVLSYNNLPVRLKDISWEMLGKGLSSINTLYQKNIRDRRSTVDEANLKFHKIGATVDYWGFKNLDMVIEAATENLDLKRKIFKELEGQIKPETIIASNTSSISINLMAESLQHPERLIGVHFFNPVPKMPLVEVIPGDKTRPEVVLAAVELCKKLNKTPLIVKDCPGFLVNRIFLPGSNEIFFMAEEGIDLKRIDKLMLNFGLPMAPFRLVDEVGIDIIYDVSRVLHEAYGEHAPIPDVVVKMYEKKQFGRKAGKGVFLYPSKDLKLDAKTEYDINPEFESLLRQSPRKDLGLTDQDIVDRCVLLMVNHAARALHEGVVQTPAELDMGMILGTGFPPFRGGLLAYADTRGISNVVEQLRRFERLIGPRYKPHESLLQLEKEKRNFYSRPGGGALVPVKEELPVPVSPAS